MTCPTCQKDAETLHDCQCGNSHCYSCYLACWDVPKLQLRDYQLGWVGAMRQALKQGHRRLLCEAPTGSGKRYVATYLAQESQRKGRETLVVGDRRILIHQFKEEAHGADLDYGIIMADEPSNREATVQVASIQTLTKRYVEHGVGLPPAHLVIIDEAHKAPRQYAKLLDRYQGAVVVGLTATPVGPGGRRIDYYDTLISGPRTSELIEAGYLLPTRVFAPSEPDIEGVTVNNGEYGRNELGRAVESCTLFADVFSEWEPYSDRPTICFVPRLKYARGLERQFERRGYVARVVEAKTTKHERLELFEDFEAGRVHVLLSVDVLREGFDACCTCGIDLQPNRQLRTYVQKCGRIRRPREGAEHAILIDMAGNYWRHPHPNENIDWAEQQEDETTSEMVERERAERKKEEPARCPNCGEVVTGPVCRCGHKIGKRIRIIRMGDGRLKEMPVEHKVNRTYSTEQKAWTSALYKAHYRGGTLQTAGHIYRREIGDWPSQSHGIVCPPDYAAAWKSKPADIYPWLRSK